MPGLKNQEWWVKDFIILGELSLLIYRNIYLNSSHGYYYFQPCWGALLIEGGSYLRYIQM